jgi:hypothetical protein
LDAAIPRRHSLKNFDPHAVARLETDMWRSYYDHNHVALFSQLIELLRSQYHLSTTRSVIAAYYAAHAAVIFQRGTKRPDYEQALPALVRYYSLIRAGSESAFDVQRAAQLELEWWIIHRQRARHAPGDLAESLAALQAELYGLPAVRFREHAQARADAMLLRDQRAQAGQVSTADWKRINYLLDESWVSLLRVVRQGPEAALPLRSAAGNPYCVERHWAALSGFPQFS